MLRGKFISIEGGEGAGKSTQARRLVEKLRSCGLEVIETHEPGGTSGAETIRDLLLSASEQEWEPLTEALLHFAARREHMSKIIVPALERGDWVVSDRFADSTMAYQGYGLGLGREIIESLYKLSIGRFKPDATIILDLPVEEGIARVLSRSKQLDRYETMDLGFHRRLHQGFLEIAVLDPNRCVVVNASSAIDVIAAKIFEAVETCLHIPGR